MRRREEGDGAILTDARDHCLGCLGDKALVLMGAVDAVAKVVRGTAIHVHVAYRGIGAARAHSVSIANMVVVGVQVAFAQEREGLSLALSGPPRQEAVHHRVAQQHMRRNRICLAPTTQFESIRKESGAVFHRSILSCVSVDL